jgi:hypothetical protein
MLLLCNLHVWVPLKAVQHILSSITLCIIHMRRARAQICSRSEFFVFGPYLSFLPSPLGAPKWTCLLRARLLQKLKLNECGALL